MTCVFLFLLYVFWLCVRKIKTQKKIPLSTLGRQTATKVTQYLWSRYARRIPSATQSPWLQKNSGPPRKALLCHLTRLTIAATSATEVRNPPKSCKHVFLRCIHIHVLSERKIGEITAGEQTMDAAMETLKCRSRRSSARFLSLKPCWKTPWKIHTKKAMCLSNGKTTALHVSTTSSNLSKQETVQFFSTSVCKLLVKAADTQPDNAELGGRHFFFAHAQTEVNCALLAFFPLVRFFFWHLKMQPPLSSASAKTPVMWPTFSCPKTIRYHRRECPAITYMAMGFRPRSFPVGGMYVKGIGRLTKVKKNHSLPFLNVKSTSQILRVYRTGSEKTSPRSTALVSRIGLQPFLRTRWYPALVPCFATAVEADFGVRLKVRQYTRQVLKRTESLIVPKLHIRKRLVLLMLPKNR